MSYDDLPAPIADELDPHVKEAEALGLSRRAAFSCWTATPDSPVYSCVFVKPGTQTFFSLLATSQKGKAIIHKEVNSELQSGQELVDTTAPKGFDNPEWVKTRYHKDLPVRQLWESHLKRVSGELLRPAPTDKESILTELRKSQERWIEYGLDRGFLVPLQAITS